MTKIEKINSATTMKSRMKGVQARSHNINCFSLIHRAERSVNQPCEKKYYGWAIYITDHRYRSLAYDSIQSVSYRKKNMDSYYIIDNVEIAFMTISFHISFQIKLI